MPEFKFGNIAALKRNRAIEGETGAELGLDGGITLIVCCASDANPRWKQFGDGFQNELGRLRRAGAGDDRVKPFLARSYVKLFLVGWRGVLDGDGQALPFTREAAEAFLLATDDAIPAIGGMVYDTKHFRGERIEAVVENAKNG